MKKTLDQKIRKFRAFIVKADQMLLRAGNVFVGIANASQKVKKFRYAAAVENGKLFLVKRLGRSGHKKLICFLREGGVVQGNPQMCEFCCDVRQEVGDENYVRLMEVFDICGIVVIQMR